VVYLLLSYVTWDLSIDPTYHPLWRIWILGIYVFTLAFIIVEKPFDEGFVEGGTVR
jgi:hypothetical protein